MDEDELKEVFRAVSDQYSNGMHSITSQNAGSGKSDFAMRWVAMEGLLYQVSHSGVSCSCVPFAHEMALGHQANSLL